MVMAVRKFDYSFLKKNVSAQLMNLSSIIYDIKGKESIRIQDNPSLFNKLKARAIIESIKGSNAIENIGTTDSRLKDLVAGETPITYAEKEILGYKNVLENIHTQHKVIRFDETTILSLHAQMLDKAQVENRGQYKKEPNYISETKNGVKRVRFMTVSPQETKFAVEQLLLAYLEASHDSDLHPLLLIPCVILDFLCIHPFDDGNGRISRLLTLLLLYKAGFDIGQFISIENIINEKRCEYYESLQESSSGWHEEKNDYFPFVKYMMQILYLCYTKLDKNVFPSLDGKISKTKRIEMIVRNALAPISKKKIGEQLPDISEKMIETVLGRLVRDGTIIKIGSFKDAKYYRK